MENITIELIPYNNHWKKYFTKEEDILKKLLKKNLIQAHHIGSTSISTTVARPTLDILAEVHTLDGIKVFEEDFRKTGLEMTTSQCPKKGIHFQRISKNSDAIITNLYILEKHSSFINDYLDFRDYLIAEPLIADEYTNLKLKISKNNNIEEYNIKKTEFIETVLKTIT